jgi:FMN phosphatase YigB (HAD superfamily)
VPASHAPSKVPPDAILFDFGGTLDADGLPWSARFHAAYAAAGGRLPYARFAPVFTRSDEQLATMPGIRSLGFRATLDLQAALLHALLRADGDRFDPQHVADVVHTAAIAVAERNRPLLIQLAVAYPLGLVSNFTGNLVPCLDELDLRAPFTTICDSGVMGIEKPDPAIFRAALAALSARPRASWMVGDNPDADLIPAAALGLRTCWLARPDDRRALPPGVPTARIASLPAFPDLLDVPCTV